MLGKSRIAVFFNDSWFRKVKKCARKAASAELAVQHRDKKLHAAVARSTCSSQNAKKKLTVSVRFSKFRCRKSHTALAPSTYASQNAQNTTLSDHFLKFRKVVRRCGAKPLYMSKYTRHLRCGALLKFRGRKIARPFGPKRMCKSQ